MTKFWYLCPIIIVAACLAGCSGGTIVTQGEGTGVIESTDFDPFGHNGGPMHLRYFTAPHNGVYQLILTSGPDQPPLPQPWVMTFIGHVQENTTDFLDAYDNGAGVIAESHGTNIAQVTFSAYANEEFTFALSSYSDGVGAYSYRID